MHKRRYGTTVYYVYCRRTTIFRKVFAIGRGGDSDGSRPGAGNVMVRCARESDRERLLLDVVGGTREKPRRTVCAMRVDVGRSNKDGRAARDAFAIRFAIDADRL